MLFGFEYKVFVEPILAKFLYPYFNIVLRNKNTLIAINLNVFRELRSLMNVERAIFWHIRTEYNRNDVNKPRLDTFLRLPFQLMTVEYSSAI